MIDIRDQMAVEPNDGLTPRVRTALELDGAVSKLYIASILDQAEYDRAKERLKAFYPDVF